MQNAARLRSVTQVSSSFCQWKFFSHPGAAVPRSRYPCYPLLLLKGNCRVKQKRQWTVCLPVDIPMGWEPRRNLAVRALRVAFADFSTTPWQGFEKSERGPNNSSLFQPLAAVVVVAVQVLLSAVTAKGKLPCKTKKTVDSLPPGRHSYGLGTAAESGGQGLTGCVC